MKKIFGLVASLTAIAGVCAGVLAYVNSLTADPIAKMLVKKTFESAEAVMPAGVSNVEKDDATGIFLGKNEAGEVIGYAVDGTDAGGYGGDIKLMVGFEADKKTVVRYRTLLASETPGLGMKLNTPEFADQFGGKAALSLAVKKDGGEIDAITSATITSRAVCRAIANAASKLSQH